MERKNLTAGEVLLKILADALPGIEALRSEASAHINQRKAERQLLQGRKI